MNCADMCVWIYSPLRTQLSWMLSRLRNSFFLFCRRVGTHAQPRVNQEDKNGSNNNIAQRAMGIVRAKEREQFVYFHTASREDIPWILLNFFSALCISLMASNADCASG